MVRNDRMKQLRKKGWMYKEIAKKYGVSVVTAWQIINGKSSRKARGETKASMEARIGTAKDDTQKYGLNGLTSAYLKADKAEKAAKRVKEAILSLNKMMKEMV